MKHALSFRFCAFLALFVTSFLGGCDKFKFSDFGQPVQTASRNPDRLDLTFDDTQFYRDSLSESETFKVALLLPKTGVANQAKLAENLANAAELALFDRGARGMKIISLDTKGTPEGAMLAFQEAVANKVDLVVGPLFSHEVKAIKKMASNHNINVLSFTTDRFAAGKGVFIMGFLPEHLVERVVRYAYASGKRDLAIFAPNNEYGQRISSHVTKIMNSYSEDPPMTVLYSDGTANGLNESVKELASRINKDTTDGLIIPDGGKTLKAILPLLPYHDVNTLQIKLLGSGLWNDPTLGQEPIARGGWFAAPSLQGQRRFNERYQEVYNQKPHGIASLAYDAISLAASVATKVHGNKSYGRIYSLIIQPNGYYGADGLFRFSPSGLVERGLSVVEITREGLITVDHAPTTFDK